MRARFSRGQAVVETALSLLVIITVVLFGIHFAEAGYAAIKVHEAAAFALWDATGRPIHDLPGDTYKGAPGASAGRANSRYDDFDSRAGANGASFTQALTRADGLAVQCALSPVVSGPPPPNVVGGVLPDTGGTLCTATANVTAIRMPPAFAQGPRGFFKEKHVERTSYTACALGRPRFGDCRGGIAILLGDWALSRAGEQATTPGNGVYEKSVERIWTRNHGKQGEDAENLAKKYVGYAPYDLPFVIENDTPHTFTEELGGSGKFFKIP